MDLKSLLQRVDDIESNAPSFRRSLSESVYRSPEMSKHWKKLDEGFFKGYDQYLKEVALTPDQIQNIFKQAGTQAGGAEAAQDPSKLEKIVDKVMPSSQAANLEKSLPEPDAGPVQGFDQKAQQAVANIQGADSATKQSLLQWAKNGLKKPETQQLILAALSAGLGGLISKVGPMLSMIPGGGPVVSAVTGALIAGAVAVASAKMQGKDWKSAFKGAIKPALMGGAAAVVGNLAASAVSGAVGAMSHKSDADVAAQAQADADQASMDNQTNNLSGGANDQAAQKHGRELPQWAQDLQYKQQQINNLAQQMGLPPGKHDVQMQGGVPVSIDGQPVPQEMYTQNQLNSIAAAQQMRDANANSERLAQQAGAGTSDYPSAGKVRANLDQWRQDTGSPNATPVTPSTPSDGSYQQAAPLGANGQPMQQVPMDTGQAPQGAAMDPAYLQGVINGEHPRPMISPEKAQAALDWQAQNGGQVQPPKGDWSSGGRASYPGGLAQYYKDHPGIRENAVDKQATLKEWLKRDQQGISLNTVQLTPMFVEGIFDFFKGGKTDAPAGDKKEPAMGASVDSLNQAWKAAGSPTDSEEVAKVLQSAGVAPDAVAKIYTDLKIPAPGAAAPEQGKEAPADQASPQAPAGQEQPSTAPAQGQQPQAAPAQPGAEPPATPAAEKQSKIGVGQINKIVPTLRVRDLKSVQKNVDNTLAKRTQAKQPAPQPTAESKYSVFYSKFLGKEI